MTEFRPTNRSTENDSQKGKRSRSHAPLPVSLRLITDIAPNHQHPLAHLDPVVREEQRLQLMASILARIAFGQPSNGASYGTIPVPEIEQVSNEDQAVKE